MILAAQLRVADVTERAGRREGRTAAAFGLRPPCCARRSRFPPAAISARFETASPSSTAAPAKPNRTVAQTPASEREHERILSSYGGAYDDPKLEALIGKTVDRLVAASDRPDQAYKVTILNSGAVNAFALPTGQLYVTRGLIALASDTSELSSVLSPRDGACAGKARLDPRGPGAAGRGRHPRRHRHEQRSRSDRAGAGENQADDGELFARSRSSRPTASASAFPRARISIPMARRASSPRWSATRR